MFAGMRIRDATVDDADALALVHVHGWQWGYRGLLPDSFLNGLSAERRAEQWRSWLLEPGRTRTRVAVTEQGAFAGFAASGPSRDPVADADVGEVYAIYLEEPFAGTGVGAGLLRSALDWLEEEGYARATLWVLEGNTRARRFYEREGWALDGTAKSEPREDFTMDEVRYAISL
jgi:GNAT superfamily N-acetyltransferase